MLFYFLMSWINHTNEIVYLNPHLSCLMTKPTKGSVCPAKTQISLGICPVWSESSQCAQWVAEDPIFLHADSEDSDQTGWMPKLIGVFTVCTGYCDSFVMRWLICSDWCLREHKNFEGFENLYLYVAECILKNKKASICVNSCFECNVLKFRCLCEVIATVILLDGWMS